MTNAGKKAGSEDPGWVPNWLVIAVWVLVFWLAFGAAQICRAQSPLNSQIGGFQPTKLASTEPAGSSAPTGCSSLIDNAKQPAISPHGVKLSWNASVPASKSPHGMILGYIVYRSTKSHDRNPMPINFARITGTSFTDCNVETGKTYYYTARAVDAIGRTSGPSNEVRVKIPH